MTPPLMVGLTGGIAAGKSTVLEMFAELGAATISADAVVHELLDSEPMLSRIRARWGDDLVEDDRVDRARIGTIVFADPEELGWLESQIHPLVRERLGEWAREEAADNPIAVAEVPLLFEGEMQHGFAVTIAVISEDELRTSRAESRGQVLNAERDRLQLPQVEKAARADHVIHNDGSPEDLRARVESLYEELLRR